MITIKNVTMKNFLSVGNVTQAVKLNNSGLTLVLGENLDLGGGDSRNGVGKTSLIQAICFALYGTPLTNIKKDNLINKTNQKGMVVSLEYELNDKIYKIERGRKPNFIRYYVNDGIVNAPDTDEGQGESKWTQSEIERVIGVSHNLFKHIVALHTKTTPFLSLRDKEQRDIIEELLGITQLSNKSEILKDQIKSIRDEIRDEEVRTKTIIESNEKIQKTINDLQFKSTFWAKEHEKKILKLQETISVLSEIDIDNEIANQRKMTQWKTLSDECERLEYDVNRIERRLISIDNSMSSITDQIKSVREHNCHTCGQKIHDEKHEEILQTLLDKEAAYAGEKSSIEDEIFSLVPKYESKNAELTVLGSEPVCHYKTLEQALNHRHILDKTCSDVERELNIENPYMEQIATLSTSGLQEVSYDYLNELVRLKEHQDFLLKLLTSKESFIRKKIIDQNLSYLNTRLNHYLEKLQLPHEVVFQSDLAVSITKLGKEYDFEQLSNGEANRLVLSFAWAFRDVWESMNNQLNLMLIDELVDSGLDSAGTDSSLGLLKIMTRERKKNIFLISHKDGLESRVDQVLLVQKENDFTNFCDPEIEI